MFNYAVLLFAVAAIVGLYMAVQHFRGRTPPATSIALLHGLLAVSGTIALLFGVAALGGLYLVSHHLRKRPLPNGVIVIHALVAVVSFLILLTAVYLVP